MAAVVWAPKLTWKPVGDAAEAGVTNASGLASVAAATPRRIGRDSRFVCLDIKDLVLARESLDCGPRRGHCPNPSHAPPTYVRMTPDLHPTTVSLRRIPRAHCTR